MQKIIDKIAQVNIASLLLFAGVLVSFFIPYNQRFISFIIVLFFLVSVLIIIKTRENFNWKLKWPFALFFLFYLVHLIGLIKGVSDSAYSILEVKLSFLVFSVIFIFLPNVNFDKKHLISKIFIGSILLTFFINIFLAFINSVSLDPNFTFNPHVGDHNYFLYSLFSIFTHPSYNAMYTSLAFAFLLKRGAENNFKNIGLIIGISVVLILNAYLLSSRAGTYALFAMLYFSVLVYYIWRKKIINTFLYALLVTLIFVGFQKINPRVVHFSKQVEKQVEVAKKEGVAKASVGNVNVRWAYWKIGFEMVSKHVVSGVGIGNLKKERTDLYRKYDQIEGAEKGHNFHNQFVETLVGTGAIGLLSLLSLFLAGLFIGLKNKDYLLLSFLIITGINFLFESMLMMSSGSIFFSFFFMFLLFKSQFIDIKKRGAF